MSGNIFDPIKSYNDPILSVNIQAIERILSKGKLKLAVLALTGLIVEYPDISELYNILEEIKGEVSGKSDIKVSAIISVYNSEEFIRGCLEDLVSQTFYQKGLLEIIVVNSGSQENEENIIKEFQAQYSNIIYIKSPVRETIYTSWNRGAKAAKGKYLVNTNSDDRLRKDALEIMAHTLDERHDVGVVYIEQIETIYANETFENHHVNGFLKRHECRKETILLFNPCGPQVMWRKDIHDLIGYFNPYYEVAGDWEFWLRIMFNTDYKIHLIPDMLGLYYKNTKGLEHSGRKQKEQLLEIAEIKREYYGVKKPVYNSLHLDNESLTDLRNMEELLDRGKPAHANIVLNNVIGKYPHIPELLNRQAEIKFQMGHWEETKRILFDLLKRFPSHDSILNNIALLHWNKGNYGHGVYYFKEALHKCQSEILTVLNVSEILIRLKKYEEAKRLFYSIDNPSFVLDRLGVEFNCGNYEIEIAEHIREVDTLCSKGNLDGAKLILKRFITEYPDAADILILYGEVSYKTGDYEEARNILLDLVRRFPYSSRILNNLGMIYHKENEHDKALSYFTMVLKNEPENKISLINAGKILEDLKKYEEAKKLYLSYLDRNPDDRDISTALADLNFNLSDGRKELWEKGIKDELNFWYSWFSTKGLTWPEDFSNRLDPSRPISPGIAKYFPASYDVSILDAGAGPLTILGKVHPEHKLNIIAVDPLARDYDKILNHFNIIPPVRTGYGEVENLTEIFDEHSFDIIHMCNSLDHSYNPLAGLRQMLRILKSNGVIILYHITNEAEKENYTGFHQFNFCIENNNFIIWNKTMRFNVNEIFSDDITMELHGDERSNQVFIKKKHIISPLISVIIPCYNQACYLPEAVESIVNQTYKNWECLIINDGSPDNTSDVARELIAKYGDKNIRLLEKPNGGLADARNYGIENSKGEYWIPLDADDKIAPDFIEKTLQIMEKYSDVGFVYSHIQHFGDRQDLYYLPDFDADTMVHNDNTGCVCSLVRKSVWEQVRGYNCNMKEGYEDWDFWVGAIEKGWKGYRIPEALFYYRKRANTMLGDANKKREKLIARIVFNHKSLYSKRRHHQAECILNDQETPYVRVMIACAHFWPSRGGLETIAEHLGNNLVKSGYRVDIVTWARPDRESSIYRGMNIISLDREQRENNIPLWVIQLRHLVLSGHYRACILLADPQNLVIWSVENADIPLHTHLFIQPVINKDGYKYWQNNQDFRMRLAKILKKASGAISLTRNGVEVEYMKEEHINPVYLPNAVDIFPSPFNFREKYNIKKDIFLILHVANLWEVKNHLALLYALRNIPDDWLLIMIGYPSEEKDYVSRFQKEIHKYPQVLYIPGLPQEQISSAFEAADIVVLASKGEVSPVTILEAMSHCKPWIATPECGAVNDHAGGIIVSLERFPEVLRVFKENQEFRHKLGNLGYQHWQECYSWKVVIKGWEELIETGRVVRSFEMPVCIENQMIDLKNEFDRILRNGSVIFYQNAAEALPLVSVIIPCYNQAHFLQEAVESVVNQTFEDWEIIIVNDGSPDDTSHVARKLIEKYHGRRIRLIEKENSGLAGARNTGIQNAKGKYVLPLDADDKILPSMLEKTVALLKVHPEIAIAYTDVQEFGSLNRMVPSIEYDFNILCIMNYITCTALFKKEAWFNTGGYNQNMVEGYEDWNFWISCGEKGFYGKRIGEPLFLYRKRPESMVQKSLENEKHLKARIILNHPFIYSPCQVAWAKGIMAYDPSVLSIPDRPYFIPQFPEPLPDNIKSILEKYNKKTRTLITMYGWNETGGGTTFPKAFAKKLVKMGMDVAVFYATATHPLHTEPYYLEYRIEEDVHLYGVYNRPAVFLDIENPEREIYDPECVKLFAGILDDFKPDLVHFHNFLGLSFAIAKEAKQRDLLTLFTPYNYHLIDPTLYLFRSDLSLWSDTDFFSNSELPVKYPSLASSYRERINASRELLNKYIDYTLAVSRRVRELLVLFGGEPDRIAVVNQVHETIEPLLINDGEYSLHKPLRFGFIGGVMPHKGVHVIVAAAQNLPAGSAEFWIYGFISEGYSNVLMSMDQKKIIKLKGPYNSSDLPDMAKELDAMILPSLWEDCAPFTITESLAMKLPVIGSNIGGFPDFIRDGVNGRLYTYNSHQELSRILREIIDNPELLIKWRENCFIHLRFEDHVNHVMDIYRTLLNGKRPPAETLSFYFLPHEKKLPILQKQEDIATDSLNRLAFSADLTGGFSNKRAAGKMPSPFPYPLYLNLGCGKDIRDGFVNIDLFSDDRRVVGMDVRKLDLPDNCADGILASDILEHFSHRETGIILREWARVLKPGGELVVRCPSLYLQIKAYWNGIWDADVASYMIFGGQTNPGDYHCTGFDEKSMRKYLTSAGLEVTSFEEIDTPQDKGFINLNMTVRARKPVNSRAGISEISLTKPVIYWEGSQFVYHSLALINRELCLQLIDRGFDVTIIPYENHQFKADADIRFNKISERLTTTLSRPADIHVRHQWPPKFTAPPAGGHWVIIQPWEYGRLRKEWVEPMRELIDEIWIPSNFVRKSYIESGIQPEKVFVVPNGFNPDIFNPSVKPFPVKTDKKFKFLFVGGTIWRKGADVLVNAYIKTFTASDDVSLIIKDIGHDTFYRGMGLGEQLKKIQENPSMPEIIYIKDFLSEKEMAGLYTACDCLLHPYRGEGFAFPVLEAMACGKPVIVTKGGATDDFCKEEFTFHVSAEWMKITFPDMELVGNEGMVLEPSMDSLMKNMRDVYENYPSAMEKADKALEFVKAHYTWDKIGNILVERINKLRNKPVLRYEKIKILMKRGETFFTEGNIDEAMKCFSSIIDIEHSSGKAHSHMATLYWKKQDRVNALKHIKEAIKFAPCDADVVWNYGHIMTERGYKSDAFKAYKEYLSKNPHDAEIKSLFDKLVKEEEIRKPSSHEKKKKDKKKKKK